MEPPDIPVLRITESSWSFSMSTVLGRFRETLQEIESDATGYGTAVGEDSGGPSRSCSAIPGMVSVTRSIPICVEVSFDCQTPPPLMNRGNRRSFLFRNFCISGIEPGAPKNLPVADTDEVDVSCEFTR